MNIQNSLLIFLGSGIGGIFRYWFSSSIYTLIGQNFPYGTLCVNISGSFLMGLSFMFLVQHAADYAFQLRLLVLVGLIGGYTTFSAFSLETVNLIERGAWVSALFNILSSVFLCLLATWLGMLLARRL